MTLRMLDCFSALGGASEGFLKAGFQVDGIEINKKIAKMYIDSLGTKYPDQVTVKVADMKKLKGKNFQGYDVIWGSPPCRNFSVLATSLGSTWKEPPNIEKGLDLVRTYLTFTNDAKPKFWIMENVAPLKNYMWLLEPKIVAPLGKSMYRAFWGNFPPFLLPRGNHKLTARTAKGKMTHFPGRRNIDSWMRAKIPLHVSYAFAMACKEKLIKQEIEVCVK